MGLELNVFDIEKDWLDKNLFIGGIKEELKELIDYLGKTKKASEITRVSYDCIKEALLGRAPINLKKLSIILNSVPEGLKEKTIQKIKNKKTSYSVQKSNKKIFFPAALNENLAYIIGVILGDGHLHSNKNNKKGNWTICVYFDNYCHMKKYNKIIKNEIGIKAKINKEKNCFNCYFCSKAIHWFFMSFFKLVNGAKFDKIIIPKRIIDSKNRKIINSCIQGLFDSDGTVTKRYAGFSSTSKKIVNQVHLILEKQGISPKKHKWLKNKKYKMLYSTRIGNKEGIKKFQKKIGFRHPVKKERLNTLLN
ncbi:MAG: LAGLIDADG family homing endonuclease [Candidatus Diapherotrites archaeon]